MPRCEIQYGGGARQGLETAEDDIDLKNDLAKYNKILEIFSLMRKDYPMYAWSLRAGGLID